MTFRPCRAAPMRLLVLLVIGLAAGCSTTVSTTTGPISDPGPSAQSGSGEDDASRRARVRMELATAYFSRGQLDIALEETRLALAADPSLGAVHNLRGLIYASKGEEALAEQSFRRALQMNPRDADTMQNLGWYLCQRKRYADADAMFAQALASPLNRDASRTLLTQGVCQAFGGQMVEAERTLTRAYELDPSNAATSVNLAEVLYRRGEYERARFYIRRVNAIPAAVSAQTLWLAARIENKLGNLTGAQEFGRQLRARFGDSREASASAQGRFDD
jgi:type IV pilus assembly protein PilF